ncbi:hypothetical protein [Kitasatospora sp. NPDC050543]|uniref:hypothetical protein n=1 Tax=Kitasatospora sp. NPDC050543 TaxID=3364054 RepID=UPI0037A864DC
MTAIDATNTAGQVPTKEQYRALRGFVKTRERGVMQEHREHPMGYETFAAWSSWIRFVLTYDRLLDEALRQDDAQAAARVWAVVLDILRPWADHPELPTELRAHVAAANRH